MTKKKVFWYSSNPNTRIMLFNNAVEWQNKLKIYDYSDKDENTRIWFRKVLN